MWPHTHSCRSQRHFGYQIVVVRKFVQFVTRQVLTFVKKKVTDKKISIFCWSEHKARRENKLGNCATKCHILKRVTRPFAEKKRVNVWLIFIVPNYTCYNDATSHVCYESSLEIYVFIVYLSTFHAEVANKSNNGAKNLQPIIAKVQLHILCQRLIFDKMSYKKWFHLDFYPFRGKIK